MPFMISCIKPVKPKRFTKPCWMKIKRMGNGMKPFIQFFDIHIAKKTF